MNDLYKRSLRTSTIVHGVLVGLICIFSMISGCRLFRPKPKEIITFVDLTVAIPESMQQAPQAPPEPEAPVEPPKPKPAQDIPEPPKEPPKAVPKEPPKEPPKPKPEKPKIEVSTNRIKLNLPPAPKPKPNQPVLSEAEIRRLLAAGAKIADQTSIPSENFPFSWYYAVVKQTMYEAWTPPGSLSLPPGVVTVYSIRVQRDGTITQRRMVRSSGNAGMDDSVMKAVNSVSRLKPLPDGFADAYKDITIEFEPAGASF